MASISSCLVPGISHGFAWPNSKHNQPAFRLQGMIPGDPTEVEFSGENEFYAARRAGEFDVGCCGDSGEAHW